jgi:hypothetical protein
VEYRKRCSIGGRVRSTMKYHCSLLVSHSLYKRAKTSIGFSCGRLF